MTELQTVPICCEAAFGTLVDYHRAGSEGVIEINVNVGGIRHTLVGTSVPRMTAGMPKVWLLEPTENWHGRVVEKDAFAKFQAAATALVLQGQTFNTTPWAFCQHVVRVWTLKTEAFAQMASTHLPEWNGDESGKVYMSVVVEGRPVTIVGEVADICVTPTLISLFEMPGNHKTLRATAYMDFHAAVKELVTGGVQFETTVWAEIKNGCRLRRWSVKS